jgi:1,4-alpha-glucan branching enzyme
VIELSHPTDFEIHLFHEGNLFRGFELFGAHVVEEQGIMGTRFCVWAPHAVEVQVVGDFNQWDGQFHKMSRVNDQGIWTLFIPGLQEGHMYKYKIYGRNGQILYKADPFAFYSELRPKTASIIYNLDGYKWNDAKWRRKKKQKSIYEQPMFIYEGHLGSWKKKEDDSFYTYKELAKELIPYVKEHGFTHIELLPVTEHPYDRSWGYQSTGYYSVTSRYGTPHDLMAFIDECHQHDIGVILDWVPGHFCKDAHGLYMFDGEPTYEYVNPKDRENEVWGTANFDLGKPEVRSFLISNAVFWMEKFHIDGFRVDAVANMLYWPNNQELHKNPYAVSFLQKLNEVVFGLDPSFLMIAEDSTDWPLVTSPTTFGGLGFNYKWNMGWMNDLLKYMDAEPHVRKHMHEKITFSLLYAFSENFILPLSHDEVVHGKKSLINKMPGDYWRKFAQTRLLMGYLVTHPGKKLLFMGGEFAQFDEWKDMEQLDWILLDFEMHQKFQAYFKELLNIYKKQRALYELDHSDQGFEWIDANNCEQSIFSFIRKGKKLEDVLVVVCNFTEAVYHNYKVGVPLHTTYKEILNSDEEKFGGTGQVNNRPISSVAEPFHGKPYHVSITIPPFGITILRPVKKRKGKKRNAQEEMRRDAIGRGKRKPS